MVSSLDSLELNQLGTYDLIMLANSLSFFEFSNLNTYEKVHHFIKKLEKLLNENGNIQVSYLFGDGFENFKSFVTNEKCNNFFQMLNRDMFAKHEINTLLFNEYDDYTISVIDGVAKNTKNVVLSRNLSNNRLTKKQNIVQLEKLK